MPKTTQQELNDSILERLQGGQPERGMAIAAIRSYLRQRTKEQIGDVMLTPPVPKGAWVHKDDFIGHICNVPLYESDFKQDCDAREIIWTRYLEALVRHFALVIGAKE